MPADPATSPALPDPGPVVVIGAGPAGLTAAYQLGKAGIPSTVLEATDVVGGISQTVVRDGYRFDIGGHRFFTKVPEVEALWHEILPDEDFMQRPRSSRIYYQGKFFDYPLKAFSALRTLGPIEAIRCALSFLWVRIRPPKDLSTLEGYVAANYGWRLYGHFFKAYSTKVWAVPPSEISAEWGAQRIKGMTLWTAVWEPFRAKFAGKRGKGQQVTSLIEEFQYPKHGPGMMWERCQQLVEDQGSKVVFDAPVTAIAHRDGLAVSVSAGGSTYDADHVISSMPFNHLLKAMDPPVPAAVQRAADDLAFRDFLSIALVVPAEKVAWTDNWIYIHDPDIKTIRVQNFGSWSPHMVKDGRNVLGLEYTVQEGDEWWTASDEDLVEKGKQELEALGLMRAADIAAGYVVRMPKAYPVYDADYRANVEVLRDWLTEHAPNVHPVGRNGMHKYNNQDHSMYTAMLTVENILGASHDIWDVNVEEEYHEEGDRASGTKGTGRDAPILPKSPAPARSERYALAAIVAGALVLRVAFALYSDRANMGFNDQFIYHAMAGGIANGDGYMFFGQPTLRWPPAYPFLISLVYRGAGTDATHALLLNAVLSTLVVLATHWCVRPFIGARAALWAAVIVALLPGQWLFAGTVLTEPLSALQILLVLGLALRHPPSLRAAVLLGLLVGWGALTRGEGALLGLLVIAAWWSAVPWRRLVVPVGLTAVVALATIAPWIARNTALAGEPTGLSLNFAETLFAGHNPRADGGAVYATRDELLPAANTAFGAERELANAELLQDLAFTWAREHPREELELIPKRLLHLFEGDGNVIPIWIEGGPEPALGGARRPLELLADATWYALFAAFLVTVVVRRRVLRVPWVRAALVLPAVSLVLYGVILYGNFRYRIPYEPIVVLVVCSAWWGPRPESPAHLTESASSE